MCPHRVNVPGGGRAPHLKFQAGAEGLSTTGALQVSVSRLMKA